MKTINNYILEKLQISSKGNNNIYDTIDDIFRVVDPHDFEWHSAYSQQEYMNKCKEAVSDFAHTFFADLKGVNKIEELWRQTYKQYLSSDIKSEDKINKYYKDAERIINKFGWTQYESYSLSQGWWVFVYWVIKKINWV